MRYGSLGIWIYLGRFYPPKFYPGRLIYVAKIYLDKIYLDKSKYPGSRTALMKLFFFKTMVYKFNFFFSKNLPVITADSKTRGTIATGYSSNIGTFRTGFAYSLHCVGCCGAFVVWKLHHRKK